MPKISLRLYINFIKEFWRRYRLLFVVVLGIGTALFLYLPQIIHRQKTTLRLGFLGQYEKTDLPLSITSLMSSGLVKIDDHGQAQPALACSWQIENEGKTYIFHLCPNLYWHDKKPITSKDIHYPFKDIRIEAKDENTLTVELAKKFSPLLSLLSRPVFKKDFIGAGEYRLSKIRYTGRFIEELTLRSITNQQKLVIRFYPSEESLRQAFMLGKIDIIWGIQEPKDLVRFPNVKVKTNISFRQYTAVFFNLDKDIFQEKATRQALAYAITKPKGKTRATGPLNPQSWAYNDFVKTYEKDIDHAKELLKDQEKIKFTLFTFPNLLPLAQQIKEDWEKINVQADIRVVNFIPSDYDALLITQIIPDDPDQYWLWHSSQKRTNLSHLNNPRLDQLLEEGRSTLDQNKRREIYVDFQKFLLEESPAIFISHPTYYYIYRRGFENSPVPLYNR